MILKTKLESSDIINRVCEEFTYEFKDIYEFDTHELNYDKLPEDFNIGLIIGSSGSGKSLLLKEFGMTINHEYHPCFLCHFMQHNLIAHELILFAATGSDVDQFFNEDSVQRTN